MKILHLADTAYPWQTGGKEIFASTLCGELNKLGINNRILIHQTENNEPSGTYNHKGARTDVISPVRINDPRMASFSREVDELPDFAKYLEEYKPDIVHFHDQNRGASLSHLRLLKSRGIKTVLTYHTPGQSCPQRALLYQNRKVCDGELKEYRCTECQLNYLGVPKPFNYLAATRSANYLQYIAFGKAKKVLQHRDLTRKFIMSFKEFYNSIDAVHVLSNWTEQMLVINEVNSTKIHRISTGSKEKYNYKTEIEKYPQRKELHLVYIGRCEPIKGIHVLIDGIQRLDPAIPVKVFFFSTRWEASAYGKKMLEKISGDPHFNNPEFVPNEKLQQRLSSMDICVIPSIWLETGPITLFDALSTGLPVVGSDLGGISEWIEPGINGLLFQPGNADELKKRILELFNKPYELEKMRNSIANPRTMKDVAKDTLKMYEKVINPDYSQI